MSNNEKKLFHLIINYYLHRVFNMYNELLVLGPTMMRFVIRRNQRILADICVNDML